ncbi:RHS repeat-associated core domain-containing protein [Flavobacterium fontis]|uniref:RHS repeat-associated core domain-containing protein n=1 Tax=Flavobacterium fontis TaxID=1124188 RepID=A0A1M4WYW9_9FLAO|nr:RHS repeat-associated core domain-containing protein [Flavobacterium fontis]SHE86162.1 RHS repeat-associated core domain-containing protein [Flavobacterium fontis]
MAEQRGQHYYNSPYKFSGKELDEETGLYYYGARYYDPKVSIWLSVDPLAEKFPEWSPYNYCLNNPVVLLDPDGRSPIDPKFVFSQTQFDSYLNYIIKNMNTPQRIINGKPRYGYTDSDKHDCVTAVNRSIRTLMNDNKIKAKANMDDQMKEHIKTNYAEKQITIDFKDASGKKTVGATNPYGYLNKTLSETIKDNLSDTDSGYQFFGMSIMDGYHSVMVVVNNTDPKNPSFNMFDQHGSMFGSDDETNAKSWYSATELDDLLMNWVENGNPTKSGLPGITTTTITPLKHKTDNSTNQP